MDDSTEFLMPEEPIQNPLCERAVLDSLRRRHLFSFNKGLGQNFLINPNIPYGIVKGSGVNGDTAALEVGPGIGCLTYELARHARKVVAVEIDRALLPILAETLPFENVEIVHADFLQLDLHRLLPQWFGNLPVAVVANLPYYITTPIVMRLLEDAPPQLRSVTVMVQREVARRLCAPPGSPDSGAISLAVEYYSEPRILFDVPAANFVPMPKVESCVVQMDLRARPAVACGDPAAMFDLIKLGFGQRRKTMVNAVGNSGRYAKTAVGDALQRIGLSRDLRAERLTLSQFAILADLLQGRPPMEQGG